MKKADTKKQAAAAAVKKLGGPSRVARSLNILPWAVSKWAKSQIPADRVNEIIEAFPNEITRAELRPDLYPSSDGQCSSNESLTNAQTAT